MIDYLIIGAGIFGATCARLLTEAGKTVKVIEKRAQVGGNCFDELVGDLLVCGYGGHIFHTNSKKIWDFVNRFSEWTPYEHRVKCKVGWQIYSFPVNLMTFEQVYGARNPAEIREIMPNGKIPERLYKMFFEGYSWKQWGGEPPPGVAERIPVRMTYDDRYFSDAYQGMPTYGYTQLVQNMLGKIPVELEADYLADPVYWDKKAERVIYSGRLDALFDCDLGALPYRSLKWRDATMKGDFQGCATVNYCDREIPYTRILEWQHYGFRSREGQSIITYEFPAEYKPGENEPMYPVAGIESLKLYRQYRSRVPDKTLVGGRLGSYQYLNMDQAVGQAMKICELGIRN